MNELLTDAVRRVCAERSYTLAEIETPHDRDAVNYRFSRAGEVVAEISVSGLEMRSCPASALQDLVESKLDAPEPEKPKAKSKKKAEPEEGDE